MPETTRGTSPNAHFLVGDTPAPAQLRSRWGNAMSVSAFTHIGGFLLIVFILSHLPEPTQTVVQNNKDYDIVWLNVPGPGGGGGGGGNQQKEPPRVAELPGKEKKTVPVVKPPEPLPKPKDVPPPPQKLEIPAQTMARGVEELPGVLQSMPSAPTSTSTGAGTGPGIGTGTGAGLGPGSGGGTGGGAYRPGSGITSPTLVKEVRPQYTADAMRAKVQGIVEVEAIINTDGTVGQVQIVRSLDSTFGLDQEAIKAVKQWRFRPGTRLATGEAVPVLVNIELTFTLR